MKSFLNDGDVKSTLDDMEPAQNWFLSIPEASTPWYMLCDTYQSGYVHWYDIGGQARRVACGGNHVSVDGEQEKRTRTRGGLFPNECPICAHVLALYHEAKRLRDAGSVVKADRLKNAANRLRAKYEAQFKAIRGQRVLVKDRAGKKYWTADWDTSGDDSDVQPGILSMSGPQFHGYVGLIRGETTPFIETSSDLVKRVFWSQKERRKGSKGGKYSAVVWTADEEPSEIPAVEVPDELMRINLDEAFVPDIDALEKVVAALSNMPVGEVHADEAVEMERDSESDVDDEFLDEGPSDAPVKRESRRVVESKDEDDAPAPRRSRVVDEEPAPRSKRHVVVEDDASEDDASEDFEDDIPEVIPPKSRQEKRSGKARL